MPTATRQTGEELRRLTGDGWRVTADQDVHRACGPAGSFVIGTDRMPAVVESGVQAVVVLWEPFPEEVSEAAGVYFVHGDHLVDFLFPQPHLLHPGALYEYEAVSPAATGA